MGNDNLTILENGRIELAEGQNLWVETPHGLVAIHIGFGGVHQITSWLPHQLKITKKSHRGNMQINKLEATFDSVCEWRKGE